MSAAELIILSVALILVAVCATVTSLVVMRLLSRDTASTETHDDDPEEPQDLATDEVPLAIPQLIFAPEYLDNDALTTLAIELDIEIDPVQTQSITGQQHSVENASSIEGRLTIPGTEVATRSSTAETNADLSQQGITRTRRSGFTDLVTQVAMRLLERDCLRLDLTTLPASAHDLAIFAKGLIFVYDRWGLRDLPPTPPAAQPPSAGQVLAAALIAQPSGPTPVSTPEQSLRDAADSLWRRALDEIVAAKRHELADVSTAGGVNYALGVSVWRVACQPDGSNLRLYNHNLDAASEDQWVLTTPAVVEVPLNPERLTDSGRQRLRPGDTLPLFVFGRIGAYDAAAGTLPIHPIAIFSG